MNTPPTTQQRQCKQIAVDFTEVHAPSGTTLPSTAVPDCTNVFPPMHPDIPDSPPKPQEGSQEMPHQAVKSCQERTQARDQEEVFRSSQSQTMPEEHIHSQEADCSNGIPDHHQSEKDIEDSQMDEHCQETADLGGPTRNNLATPIGRRLSRHRTARRHHRPFRMNRRMKNGHDVYEHIDHSNHSLDHHHKSRELIPHTKVPTASSQ